MSNPNLLVALERKYALALGRYEIAEEAVETIVGLKALAEADARITAAKKKLKEEMTRITVMIRKVCDADWTPAHVRALHLRPGTRRGGEISKKAYRILKDAKTPMSSREIAKIVAVQLGLEPTGHLPVTRIASGIVRVFEERVKAGLIIKHQGRPYRWSVKPMAERRRPSDVANSLSSAAR